MLVSRGQSLKSLPTLVPSIYHANASPSRNDYSMKVATMRRRILKPVLGWDYVVESMFHFDRR